MARRTIVVWRHGQTAHNAELRFQGHLDVRLDEVGQAQAAAAARVLAGLAPSAIVSSDLLRVRTTADALAAITGLRVDVDKRLREIDVGAWQGLTLDEVARRFPHEASEWRDGGEGRRGGGESLPEVADRARAAVDDALATLPDDATLVVVTHGAAGRALVATMIGLPVPAWKALGSLANCRWSIISERHAGWRLVEHNAGTLSQPVVGDDL